MNYSDKFKEFKFKAYNEKIQNPIKHFLIAEVGIDDVTCIDGVSWGEVQSFIYCGILGTCACGDPDAGLRYWRDLMVALFVRHDVPDWDDVLDDLMPNHEGAYWVIWHHLENHGLSEHGGCAPGWLSGTGEAVLIAIFEEIGYDDISFKDKIVNTDAWKKIEDFAKAKVITRCD